MSALEGPQEGLKEGPLIGPEDGPKIFPQCAPKNVHKLGPEKAPKLCPQEAPPNCGPKKIPKIGRLEGPRSLVIRFITCQSVYHCHEKSKECYFGMGLISTYFLANPIFCGIAEDELISFG